MIATIALDDGLILPHSANPAGSNFRERHVGVLTQTLYLMATDMGLGGCAIGSTNIDLFAKMTGIEFHVEGPVGQFALGRGS
jgi:SagB-type dehydrogenase family enzyme